MFRFGHGVVFLASRTDIRCHGAESNYTIGLSGGYTHFWVLDQWHGHPIKRRNKNAFSAEEAKRRHIMPADNANDYYVVMVP